MKFDTAEIREIVARRPLSKVAYYASPKPKPPQTLPAFHPASSTALRRRSRSTSASSTLIPRPNPGTSCLSTRNQPLGPATTSTAADATPSSPSPAAAAAAPTAPPTTTVPHHSRATLPCRPYTRCCSAVATAARITADCGPEVRAGRWTCTWARSAGVGLVMLLPLSSDDDDQGVHCRTRTESKRPSRSTTTTALLCGGAIRVAIRRCSRARWRPEMDTNAEPVARPWRAARSLRGAMGKVFGCGGPLRLLSGVVIIDVDGGFGPVTGCVSASRAAMDTRSELSIWMKC